MCSPLASSTLFLGLAFGAGLGLLLWLFLRGSQSQRLLTWDVRRLAQDLDESTRGLAHRTADALRRLESLEEHLPRLSQMEPALAGLATDARTLVARLSAFEGTLAEQQAQAAERGVQGEEERRAAVGERMLLLGQVGTLEQRLAALSDAVFEMRRHLDAEVRALRGPQASAGPSPREATTPAAAPGPATAAATDPAPEPREGSHAAARAPAPPHFVLTPARPSARTGAATASLADPRGGASQAAPAAATVERPVARALRLTAAGLLALAALAVAGGAALYAF